MSELVLYRSGGLTPLQDIPVKNPWFEQLSLNYRKSGQSLRSASVFATLNIDDAYGWVDWRHDMDMDADIWKITLPENSEVYAHPCHYYETAGFLRTMPEYAVEGEFEKALKGYWEEAFLIEETPWFSGDFYEVLIPYHVAVVSAWEKVETIPPRVFEDDPTYFDLMET